MRDFDLVSFISFRRVRDREAVVVLMERVVAVYATVVNSFVLDIFFSRLSFLLQKKH